MDRRCSKKSATGAVALQSQNPVRWALLIESGDAFFGFGGFAGFKMMAKNLLWSCAQTVAPPSPINPQRPNQAMERTPDRFASTF